MKLLDFSRKFLKAYSKARNNNLDLMVVFTKDSDFFGSIGSITNVKIPYEANTPEVPKVVGFICRKPYDMTKNNGTSGDKMASWLRSSIAKEFIDSKVYFRKEFKSDIDNVPDGIYYPIKIELDKQTKQIIIYCSKM